jgi:excisionase family DNA binding protein
MLSVGQVAERLGVSRQTVARLIESGALAAHRIGGAYKVPEQDLAAYLERTRVATTKAAEGKDPSAAGGNAP